MTFGHTSKGTKPYCPAYFIYCVMQKAADEVAPSWRILSGHVDLCVTVGVFIYVRMCIRANVHLQLSLVKYCAYAYVGQRRV